MKIKALAAKHPSDSLHAFAYEAAPLGPYDILVGISHCGVCHSDVHLIDNDWGNSIYPLVPGHEIIGQVKELGTEVHHFKKGDRVGIGWQRSSCLMCEFCLRGDENLCAQQQATCVGHHGGFADMMVVDSRFAFSIPEKLASENAAPLLCGGITVYSPLRHNHVDANTRVGIIGIGGLGHLALQFARAYGAEVTAFSSSRDKEPEARGFGAHHFVASTEPNTLKKLSGSLDLIISTVTANMDWPSYVNLLRPDGCLCFVGVPSEPIMMPVFPLISGRKRIAGSPIGGRAMMHEMLNFASRHGVAAKTEVLAMNEAQHAVEKMRKNQARYRMVLRA